MDQQNLETKPIATRRWHNQPLERQWQSLFMNLPQDLAEAPRYAILPDHWRARVYESIYGSIP